MSSHTNDGQKPEIASSADWLEVVRKKVEGLRFGTVQITVHEGRVTQIDSTERTRIRTPSSDSDSLG